MNEKLNILGVMIDRVDRAEALERFAQLMDAPGQSLIVTPNSEIVLNAAKDETLRGLINNAALVIPDGIGLMIASRQLKSPLKERVTGIDFCRTALDWCAEHGRGVYFFGAKPGVAELAAEKLKEELPALKVCGCRDGYFKPDEEAEIAAEIAASGAEFLCIALGSPKQELFAERHKAVLGKGGVRVAIGIGGSLDVWSGTLERAPEFYCRNGLEWLYRLFQEPKRFGRMSKIPLLFLKVMFSKKNRA